MTRPRFIGIAATVAAATVVATVVALAGGPSALAAPADAAPAATPSPTPTPSTSPSPPPPPPTSPTATPTATPSGPAGCAGTVQISALAFAPPTVAPGQQSVASLTVQNCTAQAQQITTQWTAEFAGSATGIPPGCPAVDPIAPSTTLAANAQANSSLTYQVPSSCTATALPLTVRISGSDGTVLATQSATLSITPSTATSTTATTTPPTACAVAYVRQSEWPGGFVATVTITNTGSSAISGWSLGFSFAGDQKITHGWNATVVQVGNAVTATNLPYNRTVNPGASTSFGFYGSWNTSDAPPTAFILNGAACVPR